MDVQTATMRTVRPTCSSFERLRLQITFDITWENQEDRFIIGWEVREDNPPDEGLKPTQFLCYPHMFNLSRSIVYLSCNKTLQGKCGYYAEAEAEATKCCQVIVSAVVLKYVSWNRGKFDMIKSTCDRSSYIYKVLYLIILYRYLVCSRWRLHSRRQQIQHWWLTLNPQRCGWPESS